jgi:hypothetical protein
MAAKRRLPVLQTPTEADDPTRAPWQWVGFGTVAIVLLWVPLAAAAAFASRIVGRNDPSRRDLDLSAVFVFVGLSAVALALASFVGGFVVGRWGGAAVGVREAALAGLAASLAAVLASWASVGIVNPGALVVVLLALPFAALGGKVGRSARR